MTAGSEPDQAEIKERVDEALHGLELEPDETAEVLGFANQEVPHFQTPETSYLVLGSFRSPYLRRLRVVETELNKRISAYATVLGDLRDIDVDRLPTFRVRFYLVASYADAVVGVYEQDAGGEITELGKISETPFFDRSHVLPRDYAWMTDRRLERPEDVLAAAVRIEENADLDADETSEEIETLVENARRAGVEVSADEVRDHVEERLEAGPEVVSYSWVHVNEFRLFELHGRCHPWSDVDDLRSVVDEIPEP